ncbi:helix-turn-helix transcriptional regulator [Streptomyces griseorubiginosus]|uniref:helix-turn-helix transcriptional regulator n=1 Tax=Streptomyces griseorubiginosus TaxID=67304 RepID=UPI0036E82BAF
MSEQNQWQDTLEPEKAISRRVPGQLVGREQEMKLLRSAIVACADGDSTVIEITGDAGLGKTRLLAEMSYLAQSEGLSVLSGRASEFEQQRAFGAFADPIRWCAGQLPDDRRQNWSEETTALLDLLSHCGAGVDQGQPRFPEMERYRLHHAVGQLLGDVGKTHGVLLCLDDLHWADECTLELLQFLLRQPPTTPLVLACGYRHRQAPSKLLASFQHAAPEYDMVHLPLSPLDQQACESLLSTVHPPDRREQLYTVSGGNPLYLEVLTELSAQNTEDFADLPDTLRAAMAREIAPLTGDELTVLRAAAVLGDPLDLMLLGPIADMSTSCTMDALDVLVAKDLLRPVNSTGERLDLRQLLQFRHPVLREVVAWDTPPGWRLAANARADRALRLSGAGPVERAAYIARSATPGDAEAVRVLTEAATLTLHTTPAIAAAWLRTALRLSPAERSGEPARRLEILLGLANASGMTGDLPACRDALEQALDLMEHDRPEERIPILVLRSVAERILGSSRAAGVALEEELVHWPESDPRADPLRLQLATVRMAQGRYDEADAHLDALEVRTSAPMDHRTLTAVAACRALGAAYTGRSEILQACASEASASIDVMNDEDLKTFLDEVGQLGWAEVLAERHGDAIRHMARGVRIAQRTGQSYMMAYLLLGQAYAQQATGDVASAIASATHAEETAHLLGRPDLVGHALTLRAAATALRDGPAAAADTAEQALRCVGRHGRQWELSTVVLASIRLDQGQPDASIELLQTIAGADRSVTTHTLRAMWYCTAAHAEVARGYTDAAREWAKKAAEAAEAVDLPGQRGYAALAQAVVHGDDPSAAAELYSDAADFFAAGGLPLAEARAQLALGRTLAVAHHLDAAAAAVGRAKQLAQTCGASYLNTLAVNAQRLIGARHPRPGYRDVLGTVLSDQERRISARVARGLTNSDIAADLFISVKTVEGHLTRIFRKLEVTSRSGLVAALVGLPDHEPSAVRRTG